MFGHTRPLEFSGETRNKVRAASINATNKMGRAAYPGASKFNFRHPKSKIRMNEEFTRLLPHEVEQLGEYYDSNWTSNSRNSIPRKRDSSD